MKDLTNSHIDRQNVLNNNTAIKEIFDQLGFIGILFDHKFRYSLSQLAKFYEVDIRTIKRLIEEHREELIDAGYEIFEGNRLRMFKEHLMQQRDINVPPFTQSVDSDIVGLKSKKVSMFTSKMVLNVATSFRKSKRSSCICIKHSNRRLK